MTKTDLFQRIIDNHNRIAQIEVRGENAILVADTLRDLRNLFTQLQKDTITEEEKKK